MRLLNRLRDSKKQSLAVVVSGEGSIHYAIKTHEAYRIMRFLVKGIPDFDALYIGTVKAALRYLDVVDLIANIEGKGPAPTTLEDATQRWQNTLAEAQAVDLEVNAFPEDLGKRIETLRKQLRDPVTQLPTNEWTKYELLQRVVHQEQSWAVVAVWIKNLGDFRNSSTGDETSLLKAIANMLNEASRKLTDNRAFVSTLGKAALEPRFVVALDALDIDQADHMKEWIGREFDGIAKSFVDQFALKRGEDQVVPELGIGTIIWDEKKAQVEEAQRTMWEARKDQVEEAQPATTGEAKEAQAEEAQPAEEGQKLFPDDQPPFSDYLQLVKALKRLKG